MMRYKIHVIGAIIATISILLLSNACNNTFEEAIPLDHNNDEKSLSQQTTRLSIYPIVNKALPGIMYVKLEKGTLGAIDPDQLSNTISLSVFPNIYKTAFKQLGVTEIERLIPYDSEFEAKHKQYGLDRWYVIYFDTDNDNYSAMKLMEGIMTVEAISPVYPLAQPDNKVSQYLTQSDLASMTMSNGEIGVLQDDSYPFNDKGLKYQWNLINKGTLGASFKKGADVGAEGAWKLETGKPNVIVAIIDGAVDYTHNDLKGSMWTNEAELNGTPGVDDDHNGYVDDIHGVHTAKGLPVEKCFDVHGTHVAGIIGARNNNIEGISSLAGGDGSADSGVRIMTNSIFGKNEKGKTVQGRPEVAFVYAADHGAVIAQNSWGYDAGVMFEDKWELPKALKETMNYFMSTAGTDRYGVQRPDSPMKGGVMIFASGNDDTEGIYLPAAYQQCISVSAMAPNFKKSAYSNYGNWITIMAPGGDKNYGTKAEILSTVTENRYGFLQGTSMACPHVSGVAALIVSKFGKQGFTAEECKYRLITSILPESIDNNNPDFKGQLGRGYISAANALATNQQKAPLNPPIKDITFGYDWAKVLWEVPKDEDDNRPDKVYVYFSDKEITKDNVSELEYRTYSTQRLQQGDTMSYHATLLKPSTTYYFALKSEDRWGLQSSLTFGKVSTMANHAPVIQLPEGLKLISSVVKPAEVTVKVSDPDGHSVSYRLSGDTKGVTHVYNKANGEIKIIIAPQLPEGNHSFVITARDELGAVTEAKVEFAVVSLRVPVLKKEFTPMVLSKGESLTYKDLNNYFDYSSAFSFVVEATSDNSGVTDVSMDNAFNLTVSAKNIGKTQISIKAVSNGDPNYSTTYKIPVMVVTDRNLSAYVAYPLPFRKELNVRLNDNAGKCMVYIYSATGNLVYKQLYGNPDAHVIKIDTAPIPPGTYTLVVESDGSGLAPFRKVIVK